MNVLPKYVDAVTDDAVKSLTVKRNGIVALAEFAKDAVIANEAVGINPTTFEDVIYEAVLAVVAVVALVAVNAVPAFVALLTVPNTLLEVIQLAVNADVTVPTTLDEVI